MRPIGTAEELERRRRRGVELVKRGESPTKVASFLGCGRSSGSTWLKAEREAPGLRAARPHPGPTPRLTDEPLPELERLLRQGAGRHGWPNDLWGAHRFAEMIRRHFGVGGPVVLVRNRIRRRLNWSGSRPLKKARQRNELPIARRPLLDMPPADRDQSQSASAC
ncbi:helix-turn-helix domain-containing protein [Tautonia sociabilis]|uniref:Transposase n=1 Tax=Tautonia sociabilis TaxID=2080755 RepID=A0A432MNQ4_9BACT|nr:helix-turn-helix domain-containing protein [Tautonia sociabilis]RUL88950.1 hypothetical protein TsocGM_04970 [Tautonia sociabilis]